MMMNGILGLCGETGEVADQIKKHLYQGHELSREDLINELGDVCWYIAQLASSMGTDLNTVLEKNIEKLRLRYPDGFSVERSLYRD